MRRRIVALALLSGALTIPAILVVVFHIAVNVTPSMPLGIYRLAPVDRPIARGDIVDICPPSAVAKFLVKRGGVRGDCLYQIAPLLKFVAGLPGDVIDLRENAVVVNGAALPGSATISRRDGRGRLLVPRIPRGRYVLAPGRIWLWSPYYRSLDSRYFGPVPAASVRYLARSVFAGGTWADWEGGLRVLASVPSARKKNELPTR